MYLLEELLQISTAFMPHPCFRKQATTTSGLKYPDTEIDVFAETHFRETSQLAIYIGTYSHIKTSGVELIHFLFPATNTSCSKERGHGIIYRFLCSRERIVCTVWSSKSIGRLTLQLFVDSSKIPRRQYTIRIQNQQIFSPTAFCSKVTRLPRS